MTIFNHLDGPYPSFLTFRQLLIWTTAAEEAIYSPVWPSWRNYGQSESELKIDDEARMDARFFSNWYSGEEISKSGPGTILILHQRICHIYMLSLYDIVEYIVRYVCCHNLI